MNDSDDQKPKKVATRLVRAGRDPAITGPFINPPVVHASTVLYPSIEAMEQRRQKYEYGRRGTPTSDALEQALCDLEGAAGVVLAPSGLTAASLALLSCLSAGDEVLIVDCVYGPVRHFADTVLTRLGIVVTYYDPAVGAGIEALFTPRTRAVYMEVPGSLTFEMQDVSAIAAVAHRHSAAVLLDNTWATPLYFRPLEHGVDIAVMAATKYIGGHSDVMVGTAAANAGAWKPLKELHGAMGLHLAPDDIYLTLRGLRTLGIRLERHQASALHVSRWLQKRPEVARVIFPALPEDTGHALWKRYMSGAPGLFAVIMRGWSVGKAKAFADGLALFGIGASWGGFESLVTLPHIPHVRSATRWTAEGPILRLHIGLEDPDDLIADLDAAFARVASRA